MTLEEFEEFRKLKQQVAEILEHSKTQDRQITELQGACGALAIRVKELELLRDTGYVHRYCKECNKYVKAFSGLYMDHPAKGNEGGRCPNSIKRAPEWS